MYFFREQAGDSLLNSKTATGHIAEISRVNLYRLLLVAMLQSGTFSEQSAFSMQSSISKQLLPTEISLISKQI
jgi:hypothetical protein